MVADPIGRAHRAADSLFGGPGVREFADREFPREGLAWVAAQTRRPRHRSVSALSGWRRLWRAFRAPGESERDTEAVPDPVTA